MEEKFVIFNDFCDPYIKFYDDLEDAILHFKERKVEAEKGGIDVYLCKVLVKNKINSSF